MKKNKINEIVKYLGYLIILICIYIGISYLFYGQVVDIGIGKNKKIVLVDQELTSKYSDVVFGENGECIPISKDSKINISEDFPIKTIVIKVDQINRVKGKKQVQYSVDGQQINIDNVYLKKGLNYIQVPNGKFNDININLVDYKDTNIVISKIEVYGSRVFPCLFWVLVFGLFIIFLNGGKLEKYIKLKRGNNRFYSLKEKISICIFYFWVIDILLSCFIYIKGNNEEILKIIALPEKNFYSEDIGVGILEIFIDGKKLDFSNIKLSDGWTINSDNILVGYKADKEIPVYIDLHGAKKCSIKYISRSFLGKMQVKLWNQSYEIDCYDDNEWVEKEIVIENNNNYNYIIDFSLYNIIICISFLTIFSLKNNKERLYAFIKAFCVLLACTMKLEENVYYICVSEIVYFSIYIFLYTLFYFYSRSIKINKKFIILGGAILFGINTIIYNIYQNVDTVREIIKSKYMFCGTLVSVLGYIAIYYYMLLWIINKIEKDKTY